MQMAILSALIRSDFDLNLLTYSDYFASWLISASWIFPWAMAFGLLVRTQYFRSWILFFLGSPFWMALSFLMFARFYPETSEQISWEFGLVLFLIASFGVWSTCFVALIERRSIRFSVGKNFITTHRFCRPWQAEFKWPVYTIRICLTISFIWAIWWSLIHIPNTNRYFNQESFQQALFTSMVDHANSEAQSSDEFYFNKIVQHPHALRNFLIPLIEKMQPEGGDLRMDRRYYQRLKIRQRAPHELRLQTLEDWLKQQEYLPSKEFSPQSVIELKPGDDTTNLLHQIQSYLDCRGLHFLTLNYTFNEHDLPIAAEWATLMEPLVWELLELSDYPHLEEWENAVNVPSDIWSITNKYVEKFSWIVAGIISYKIGLGESDSALRLTTGLLETYNKRWFSPNSTIESLDCTLKRQAFNSSIRMIRELQLTDAQFDTLLNQWKATVLAESNTAEFAVEKLLFDIYDSFLKANLRHWNSAQQDDLDWRVPSYLFTQQPWLVDWEFAGTNLRRGIMDLHHRIGNSQDLDLEFPYLDFDDVFTPETNAKNCFPETLYALMSSPQYKAQWLLGSGEQFTDFLMLSHTLRERTVLRTRFSMMALLIERFQQQNNCLPKNLMDVSKLTSLELPLDWFVHEALIYEIQDDPQGYNLYLFIDFFGDKVDVQKVNKENFSIENSLPRRREEMFSDFPFSRFVKIVESE